MDATSSNRRRLLKRLVIALFGLLLCAVISAGVFIYVLLGAIDQSFSNQCAASQPRKVEGLADFKLPPSGNLVFASCGGMQGMWAEAHFEMKPDELKTFLATTSVANLSTSDKPEKLFCTCGEDVAATDSYLYGIYDSPEWLEECLLIPPIRTAISFTSQFWRVKAPSPWLRPTTHPSPQEWTPPVSYHVWSIHLRHSGSGGRIWRWSGAGQFRDRPSASAPN